jgi:hypothetical protein
VTQPWQAAEQFISAEVEARRAGLAALRDSGGLCSPLTIYLLVARLDEPDLALRREIVEALGDCLWPSAPPEPRALLIARLSGFGRPQVEWLLETIEPPLAPNQPIAEHPAARLLDRVPQLAGLLTRIAADRSTALGTRLAALAVLADLGVLEALPVLEGLKTRLEGQSAGQLAMAFAPAPERDYRLLLQTVTAAIDALRENE